MPDMLNVFLMILAYVAFSSLIVLIVIGMWKWLTWIFKK